MMDKRMKKKVKKIFGFTKRRPLKFSKEDKLKFNEVKQECIFFNLKSKGRFIYAYWQCLEKRW